MNETQALLDRIDALQQLLVCYRTGGRPTEKLFRQLDKTAKAERDIRERLAL